MINLFINYYKDTNSVRQKELDYCIFKNISNQFLNTVVINSQDRLTFEYFFKKINLISGPDDINVVSNSDIYLDETIMLAEKMGKNQCFALSRWDSLSNGTVKHFNRADSQDTWVFKGKIKENLAANFNMGFRGCDNRLAHEIRKAGYNISNPSLTIKTYHVQNSNIRNYTVTSDKFLVQGPYLTITPEHLKYEL